MLMLFCSFPFPKPRNSLSCNVKGKSNLERFHLVKATCVKYSVVEGSSRGNGGGCGSTPENFIF